MQCHMQCHHPRAKRALAAVLVAATAALGATPRSEATPQVPSQPFGGSPTAAAERMLGATAARG
ncbi:MAG: hypothetical protein QF724_13745, partial [Planctomycetota bacterium]|nr:hypothetical protein [Planctomycetota bacterium]